MAQKHKSKYKAPKDLEKSQKPSVRKDLKDYTMDNEDSLNPKSAGEKQLNVLRKTDKEVVDTGDMYVKYNSDDRLYKDLEDGEWDPKHAAKVMKKRQDSDEKDNEKNIKDKIENLTREQKERLVREYIRQKIYKVLVEQEEPATDTPEEPAAEAPATEEPAATPETTPEAPATEEPAAAPAPAPSAETPETPPAEPTAEPAEQPATDSATELSPESKEAIAIEKFVKQLKADGGNIARIKTLAKVINLTMKEAETEDKHNFYKLLRQFAIKKLSTLDSSDQPAKK